MPREVPSHLLSRPPSSSPGLTSRISRLGSQVSGLGSRISDLTAHVSAPGSQLPALTLSLASCTQNIQACWHRTFPCAASPSSPPLSVIPESRNPGIPSSRRPGIPSSRRPVIPESRHPGIPSIRHPPLPSPICVWERAMGIGCRASGTAKAGGLTPVQNRSRSGSRSRS
jgi:hypothetical protein